MNYLNRIKSEAPEGENQFYYRLVRYAILGLAGFMLAMGALILIQTPFQVNMSEDGVSMNSLVMGGIFLLHGVSMLMPFGGTSRYRTILALMLLPGTMMLIMMGIIGLLTPAEQGGSISTGVMILIPAVAVIGYFYRIGQAAENDDSNGM